MDICWDRYWGWAKPVADIYEEAIRRLGGVSTALHYGPAHIVWEDENWNSVDWCLEHFDEYLHGILETEAIVIRWSLEELAKIPLAERDFPYFGL